MKKTYTIKDLREFANSFPDFFEINLDLEKAISVHSYPDDKEYVIFKLQESEVKNEKI